MTVEHSPTEYQPMTDLAESQFRLAFIAYAYQGQEVPDSFVYKAGLDILATRGGERWEKLDELYLVGMQSDVYVSSEKPNDIDNGDSSKENTILYLEVGLDNFTPKPDLEHGGNYTYRSYLDGSFASESGSRHLTNSELLAVFADIHTNAPIDEVTKLLYND